MSKSHYKAVVQCSLHVLWKQLVIVRAERMASGRLFQATGPVTKNARLPSCSLVLDTNKLPRAAELPGI